MNHAVQDSRYSLQERVTDCYIITMLLIFPLFPGFSGYRAITLSKFLFFALSAGLWAAALSVSLLLRRTPFLRPAAKDFTALAYLLICMLSWLCSPDRTASFLGAGRYDGLLSTVIYILIFLGVSAFSRPEPVFAKSFACSVSLCLAVALLQLAGCNPLRLFPAGLGYYDAGISYSGAFLGTIGNTNVLDAILCLALPMFSALFVTEQGRLYLVPVLLSVPVLMKAGGDGAKLAFLVCMLISMPLLLTNTQRLRSTLRLAAYLCAAAAISLLWQPSPAYGLHFTISEAAGWLCVAALLLLAASLFPALSRIPHDEKKFRRFFLLLSVLVLLTALTLVLLSQVESGTVFELRQFLLGHAEDSFGSSRIRIWRRCLQLFPEHPLLGGGPGTLALRLDIEFRRYVAETGKTLTSFADNAHNIYLAALTDTGIFGLASLLVVLYFPACTAWKHKNDPLIISFALGAVCCAVHEFFGLGLCISMPLFWLFSGLLCAGERRNDFLTENEL